MNGNANQPISYGIDKRHTNYEIMSEKLSTQDICVALVRAFKTWELAANINFIEINYGQDIHCNTYLGLTSKRPPYVDVTRPKIQLGFFKGYHKDNQQFDGVSGTLAHAYYPGRSSFSGMVHFDREEPWTLDQDTWVGNDLFLVATHEIGHSLGIGHSDVQGSIMFSAYQSVLNTKFSLHWDDLSAIRSLYGSRDTEYDQSNMPAILKPKSLPVSDNEEPSSNPPSRDNRPQPTDRPTSRKPFSPTRPNKTPTPSKPPPTSVVPTQPKLTPHEEVCQLEKFQAAGFYRGEFWVFHGKGVYRNIGGNDWSYIPDTKSIWETDQLDPTQIDDFFESRDTSRSTTNGMLYLIAGELMFKFDGTILMPGWPKTLKSLGKTGKSSRIIGSTYWTNDNVAYMFDNRDMFYA